MSHNFCLPFHFLTKGPDKILMNPARQTMSVENSSRTWSIAVSNSTRLLYNLWLITCDRKREEQSFSMNYQKQLKIQPLHRTYFTAFWRHTWYTSVKEWTRQGGKASPAPTPNPDIQRTSAPQPQVLWRQTVSFSAAGRTDTFPSHLLWLECRLWPPYLNQPPRLCWR